MEKSKAKASDVYRVEKLMSRRQKGRRVEYLVKWKNWSESHNTWEPEKNILDRRLIETFRRNVKRTEHRSRIPDAVDKSPPELTPAVGYSASTDLKPIARSPIPMTLANSTKPSDASPSSPPPPPELPTLADSQREEKQLTHTTLTATPPLTSSHPSPITDKYELTTGWVPDRRFRPSTLIVAAASASAAHTAAAMASSRFAIKHAGSTLPHSNQTRSPTPNITEATSPTVLQRPHSPCNPTVPSEDRPKIRLTIPRERLLPCPPPGVSSSTSSGSQNSSQLTISSSSLATEDDTDAGSDFVIPADSTVESPDTLFLAPTELPRRVLSAMSPPTMVGLRPPDVIIEPIGSSSSPISPLRWSRGGKEATSPISPVPKFVLHPASTSSSTSSSCTSSPSTSSNTIRFNGSKRRHSSPLSSAAESVELDDHPLSLHGRRKRKHPDRREKRRRHREHHADWTDSESYAIEANSGAGVKIRRRSGSNLDSGALSGNCTSVLTNKDSPRLAPLRILLPRPVVARLGLHTSASTTRTESHTNKNKLRKPSSPRYNQLKESGNNAVDSHSLFSLYQPSRTLFLSPNSKQFRLVHDICVTDVTVGGLTISIKESSGPENFFGVPSNQLVQWTTCSEKVSIDTERPILVRSSSVTTELTVTQPTSPLPVSHCSDSSGVDENLAPDNEIAASLLPGTHCIMKPASPLGVHLRDLSTIYEESTLNTSTSTHTTPVTFTKPESSPITDHSASNAIPLITEAEPTESTAISVMKPEALDDNTSALIIAARDEAVRMASENPSSPGILVSPRRSSTPIERSPTRVWTPPPARPPVSPSITRPGSLPLPSTSVGSTATCSSPSPVTPSQFLPPTTSPSPATIRPIVTIPSITVSSSSTTVKPRNPKSVKKPLTTTTTSRKPSKAKPFTQSNGRGSAKSTAISRVSSSVIPNDPTSVYQFTDATSPTHSTVHCASAAASRRRQTGPNRQFLTTLSSKSEVSDPCSISAVAQMPIQLLQPSPADRLPINLLVAQLGLNVPPGTGVENSNGNIVTAADMAAAAAVISDPSLMYLQQQLQTFGCDSNNPFPTLLLDSDRNGQAVTTSTLFPIPSTTAPIQTWPPLIMNPQLPMLPAAMTSVDAMQSLTPTTFVGTPFGLSGPQVTMFQPTDWMSSAFTLPPSSSVLVSDDVPIDLSTKR